MSNWDLMMPGMGLTAIGLAGVTISYAGVAHTFVDGMHALTGLTMFVGLIFLSAGILDGGISTSNRAKATTLVIISIGLGFGMFAFTMNSSNYTVTLAGLLMAVAFPSIIIAYLAMKKPQFAKPVGVIVGLASATGIIMWFAFGFVSPDTYMVPEPIITNEPEKEEIPTGPVFTITMLKDSSTQGNPDFDPDVATVQKGTTVIWVNADTAAHTATSSVDLGETFDSNLVNPGEKFSLDTSKLATGEYQYVCNVHPWMTATLVIEEPTEPVKVVIPQGAGTQQIGQKYYDPDAITITKGTTVVWENTDSVVHTVSSGNLQDGSNGIFDSGMINAGESFKFTFNDPGKQEYFCMVHPWMTGSVTVE